MIEQNYEIKFWNGKYGIIAENQNEIFPRHKKFTRLWGFWNYREAEEFIDKYLKKDEYNVLLKKRKS